MTEKYYCSRDTKNSDEPIAGTAHGGERVVLIELPHGKWGANPIRNIEEELTEKLLQVQSELGSRILFISLEDNYHLKHSNECRAYIFPDEVQVSTESFSQSVDMIVDYATGNRNKWQQCNKKVLLVCTHGKRDKCCAKFGYPIFEEARRLSKSDDRYKDIDVWRVSHLGGDRHAPNTLILPFGHMHCRLDVSMARDLLESTRGDENLKLLDCYRGNFFCASDMDISYADCIARKVKHGNTITGDYKVSDIIKSGKMENIKESNASKNLKFTIEFDGGSIFQCAAHKELFENLVPDCKAQETRTRVRNAWWVLDSVEQVK